MLRNGAAAMICATAATRTAAWCRAKPRSTIAFSPSHSMLSAGSRQLKRSPNPGSPERDRAQCGGVLTRPSEHVIDIGAGDDEPCAEADQLALQRDIVADATDPQHFAVRP